MLRIFGRLPWRWCTCWWLNGGGHPYQSTSGHGIRLDGGIPSASVRRNGCWTLPPFFGGGVGPTTTTTLSQLRSWHCHLLQDYKHMVLGEPTDICTDCGASPQDVRHVFACTTHPTDLSPEDLWRIRWDPFVH